MLERITPVDADAVEACLRAGLLQMAEDSLSFRHELARDAVAEGVPAFRRATGHRAIFEALSVEGAPAADAARRVHHAAEAGLSEQVAALAPQAARDAAATGAHREAARLYDIALQNHPGLAPTVRAELLEAQAHECLLTNQHRTAIVAREQACEIRRALGDALGLGVNLRWLARLNWLENGSGPTMLRLAKQAIDTLRTLPPHRELARAYSTLSHLHLVGEDLQSAQHWGLHAIELAEALDDAEALSHALNNVGTAA